MSFQRSRALPIEGMHFVNTRQRVYRHQIDIGVWQHACSTAHKNFRMNIYSCALSVIAVTLSAAFMLVAPDAQAARPLITDDARVVDNEIGIDVLVRASREQRGKDEEMGKFHGRAAKGSHLGSLWESMTSSAANATNGSRGTR